MTPQEHYEAAEALLEEGAKLVRSLKLQAKDRGHYSDSDRAYDRYTLQMDETGKKLMGIWAQAQVHATLATIPFTPPRYGTELI